MAEFVKVAKTGEIAPGEARAAVLLDVPIDYREY